jgi:hypothetical protein
MKAKSGWATRARTAWIRLGFPCLLLGTLACGGGGSDLSAVNSGPPTAPTIAVPAAGTVGFQVIAAVQGASSSFGYNWTIAPGTFKGGSNTATGNSVTFTPTGAGTVTLTCVAIAGNVVASPPATQNVTITPPSTSAGSFQPAGTLLLGRQGMAAALLSSDTILVTGGSATPGGAALNSTEIFTISSGLSRFGQTLTTVRAGHAITSLSATQFLITGGTGTLGTSVPAVPASATSSEIYDSGTGGFSLAGNMANGRSGHTATPITSPAGVLVAGGVLGGTWVGPAEWFDPVAHTFSVEGSVNLAPGHTATTLPGGTVLLVSHSSSGSPYATIYDPNSGTFLPTANQPAFAREGHQALLLASPQRVLILGGASGGVPLASAEWYDPVTQRFTTIGVPMASPRRDFGAAILQNGQVLLLGGTADGSTAVATSELFDPVAISFTPAAPLGAPRRGPTVITAGGTVLVLGGSNETQGVVPAVEAFITP